MKVGVFMGGVSSEREISLMSGNEIIKNINKDKYQVIPVIIDSKDEVIEKAMEVDFAFLAFHGSFGEDGAVQALLESVNIPYSGCGILTSALCMNKEMTKRILKAEGIPTPPYLKIRSLKDINYEDLRSIGYPLFIKPNNGGSSLGASIAKKEEEVLRSVAEALSYDNEVLIEKHIKGEEITSFVLDGEVFPTLTIDAKKGEFFDYDSKYQEDGAEEKYVQIEEELQNKINIISKTIWDVLGCTGYCRIDMIIDNNKPFVLEVNTLPGMTSKSLIPKSAEIMGISYSELLDKIIEVSLK